MKIIVVQKVEEPDINGNSLSAVKCTTLIDMMIDSNLYSILKVHHIILRNYYKSS